jgi:protein-tyrosine phosphatase
LIIKLADGNFDPEFKNDYKVGLKYHWPIEGDLWHLADNPKAVFQVLADSLNPKVRSNIQVSDFKPNLFSLKNEFRPKNLVGLVFRKSQFLKFLYRARSSGAKIAAIRFFTESTGIQLIRYSKIDDYLYLGCQHGRLGKAFLKIIGIASSLNLRDEFDDYAKALHFKQYCYIPVVEFTAPSLDDLIKGVNFLKAEVSAKRKVFIHCSEGVSRASTFVVAYLISEGYAFESALAKISKIRPFVHILTSQKAILLEYERLSRGIAK